MKHPTFRSVLPKLVLSCAVGFASLACEESGPTPATDAADRAAPEAASHATSDVDAVLAEALSSDDSFERARRLGELLPTLGPEAVESVKAALEHFRLDLGAVEFDMMLRFWALHDPAAATHWTFKRAGHLYRTTAARTTIEIFAEQDPAGAVVATESATRESSEDVAQVAQMALVRGWFRRGDHEALQAYIHGLGSSITRQRSLYAYALSLAAAEGPEAAIAWAEAVPDDDRRYKLEVFRQTMVALNWGSQEDGLRFCEKHCDGPFGTGLREILTRTRLRNGDDGGEVVSWVGALSETDPELIERKKHSLWVAYATWAHYDQDAAVAWMRDQLAAEEPAPWLAYLYGEYARQIAVSDPEEAIAWAERVADDVDRERTLVRIARYWLTRDPEAASAWLEQSELSEASRAKARDQSVPTYLPGLPS